MKYRTLPQEITLARAGKLRIAFLFILFPALILFLAGACRADDAANQAAQELARKIAAQINSKQSLHIELRDLTGELSQADMAAARGALENEFRAHGIRIAEGNTGEIEVQVSLSNTPRERLWIADISADGKATVVMVSFTKPSAIVTASDSMPVRVQGEFVFEQADPILDFSVFPQQKNDAARILILGAQTLALQDYINGHWVVETSKPITRKRAPSRDMRGRIYGNDSKFTAHADGTVCTGDIGKFEDARCDPVESADSRWQIPGPNEGMLVTLASGKNWFDTPKPSTEIYSAAGFEVSGKAVWITSGVDGKARVTSQTGEDLSGPISGLGSDLAATKTDCGDHWQLLATGVRDYTGADEITAYEWNENGARAVSNPFGLKGTIVALWSDRDGGPARAVIHDFENGKYEAYLFSVTCSH